MENNNEIEIENKIKEILSEIFKDLIISSKQTMDLFLKQENASDLIALYDFYYYTAKWQKTNIIKCPTIFVSNELNWTKERVILSKKFLINNNLIEDVKIKKVKFLKKTKKTFKNESNDKQ